MHSLWQHALWCGLWHVCADTYPEYINDPDLWVATLLQHDSPGKLTRQPLTIAFLGITHS